MLMLAAIVLLALGLGAGAILLGAPFGLLPAGPDRALWLLFPGFTGIGYLLFVIPATPAQIRLMSRIASALLLGLATASAVGIFLVAAGQVSTVSASTSLWYVLLLGTLFGALGLMSARPADD